MGLWDKLKGELIDIIEWTQPDDARLLCWRFPRYNNEIKWGAKLTVREGQAAILVNEGKLADVFPPGMYSLTTHNMPILTTLMNWAYGFESPFKAEVYFVLTRQQTDNKWGTASPILLRDQDFGMVRVRAFGAYSFKVSDPAALLRELVATDPNFEVCEIDSQLRAMVVSKFADAIGKLKLPVLDLVGNYGTLSQHVLGEMKPALAAWGLELTSFLVENIGLPPEVEAAVDKRASMAALGNLDSYAKMQAADALRDAARNEGGGAVGAGIGLGAGAALGQQLAHALAPGQAPVAPAAAAPPPLPGAAAFHLAVGGQQAGPFGPDSLRQHIAAGTLTAQTLAWRPGMGDWVAAGSIPELAALLPPVPPPLPPG